jgi:hypothetical protein
MFAPNSRYANQPTDVRTLADRRIVTLVRPPLPGLAVVKGWYRKQNGQRLDLIAASFLADPTASWQLCDANNAVVPDALASQDLIGIPLNAPAGA